MAVVRTLSLILCCYLQVYGVFGDSSCTEENAIRLTQTVTIRSPDENVGRVELCINRMWGTINLRPNLPFWEEKNVQVACRQLGFSGGLNSIPTINISKVDKSPSNLAIHFRDVTCKGEERSLTNCSVKTDTSASNHHNDVFIVCRPTNVSYSELHVAGESHGDIRLFGDASDGVGSVEIFTDRGWTGICPDSSWTGLEASAICRALGYDFGSKKNFEVTGSYVSRTVYDARCGVNTLDFGTSSRVKATICSFQAIISPDDCLAPPNMFAGVECGTSDKSRMDSIRLFRIGEADPDRAVGVVEVFLENRWGVVCSDESESVAKVLCTGLSFDGKDSSNAQISLPVLRTHESNLKPLWVNKIMCPTNSTSIADCTYEEPFGFSNCSSHRHILAIDCGSTVYRSDGNTAAIIIGIGVMIFVFVLVFIVFGRIICSLIKKRESEEGAGFLSDLRTENRRHHDELSEDTKSSEDDDDKVKLADRLIVGSRRRVENNYVL